MDGFGAIDEMVDVSSEAEGVEEIGATEADELDAMLGLEVAAEGATSLAGGSNASDGSNGDAGGLA
jgi:hypothetical protein